ncbi:MAG: hypothetical protein K2J79_08245, partial [Ruminiclostridium sp.]|nr:hypothetical protein [Ruminiclostridium sp.]
DMSIKKRFLSAVTAIVIAVVSVMEFSGCSSQVNYALEINGEKIPSGLYILFSGYAYQQAQQKFIKDNPDTDTSKSDFDFTAQKVSDMDFMDYVKQETVNYCKRYAAVANLFDQLKITFDDEEKDQLNDAVNSQWDYEVPDWISSSMPYIKGFSTVGEYYESIGVSKASLKLYISDTMKASKIFTYYYGEGGIEEVSKADKEKWLEGNYALCRYFPISLKDISGKLIESKTELAILKEKATEYAKKLQNGESYKDVYNEYVEYSKAQTSTAATTTPAGTTSAAEVTTVGDRAAVQADEPEVTTAAVEETQPEEVTTDNAAETEAVTTVAENETEPVEVTADATTATEPDSTTSNSAASTTPSSSETGTGTTTSEVKDSDYDRIISTEATSPSEKFVKALFGMNKDDATVIEEDTAYYVVQRLDILKSDQKYAEKYDSNALQGLKGEDMEAAFKKEYEDYTVTENKGAPDYCKQQASNASNALNAINQIQYLIYYYSSMFGGAG